MYQLKNREFVFDVDVSTLPCGVNGALYFVQMDADGGLSKYPLNQAGAAYGTGCTCMLWGSVCEMRRKTPLSLTCARPPPPPPLSPPPTLPIHRL